MQCSRLVRRVVTISRMIESNREQLPAYVDQVAVLAITKSRRQNPAPDYNGAALWRRLFFLSLSVTATELEANMALSLSLSLSSPLSVSLSLESSFTQWSARRQILRHDDNGSIRRCRAVICPHRDILAAYIASAEPSVTCNLYRAREVR